MRILNPPNLNTQMIFSAILPQLYQTAILGQAGQCLVLQQAVSLSEVVPLDGFPPNLELETPKMILSVLVSCKLAALTMACTLHGDLDGLQLLPRFQLCTLCINCFFSYGCSLQISSLYREALGLVIF